MRNGTAGGVVAEGLVKRFGDFTALAGVDFEVAEATVVGLLGPNGAGKTTAIRILTTLLRLDGGRATVGATTWRVSRNWCAASSGSPVSTRRSTTISPGGRTWCWSAGSAA